MVEQSDKPFLRRKRIGRTWLALCGIVVLAAFAVGLFTSGGEWRPIGERYDNDFTLVACTMIGGVIVSGAIGFWATKGRSPNRRGLACLGYAFVGSWLAALPMAITSLVEEKTIFTAAQTRTVGVLLPIDRFMTYSGDRTARNAPSTSPDGWFAVGAAPWANFYISPADASFVLAHRRAGDVGANGALQSGGYFCSRVTVQQAGHVVRVLGTSTLPPGSIGICREMKASDASVQYVDCMKAPQSDFC